jgi:uncharacterized RDD family membrane protein YckC
VAGCYDRTLTLPVVLYLALSEASQAQATLGKRVLSLRVTATDSRRPTLARSLVRSALKFAPWELAHAAIWHTPGQPFVSPPAPRNVAGHLIALGLAAWYAASLFVGDGRTPYDRVAGTLVLVDGRAPRCALFLVTTLPRGTAQAGPLLLDAAPIWLASTVVFAIWYWQSNPPLSIVSSR